MSSTSNQIRKAFTDFFAGKDHEVVKSGPLIPPNDASLMFANAGMVQFKDVFTGREQRPYKRATSSQKCIRISGKHNDLEAVGPSPRHHTFFEMLGNFSFGDYFKEEAIVFAWEFLSKTLDMPTENLVCTYFAGEEGVPADIEARDLWKKVTGFSDERIIGCGKNENFWQMGDSGPCGPCSEIHIFNGGAADFSTFGAEQTADGQGWMEIWNLVFMQFEQSQVGGKTVLEPLPAPSIDTGAGLERLACVMQGKLNNYDTDVMRALVERAAALSGKKYGGTMSPDDVSMRVIADHARLAAFLVSENVVPGRTKREYVLRRIIRRAVRHGHRLGIQRGFLHEVALEVGSEMGEHYTQLVERKDLISSVVEAEEERFRETLERGLGLIEERLSRLDSKLLPGADVFELYDTYGFPDDLTEVICAERGYSIDRAAYDKAREEARNKSRFKSDSKAVEQVYREALGKVRGSVVTFTGYEKNQGRSKIVAIIVEGALAEQAAEGDAVEIVVEQTPFYGEAGGQAGDAGDIEASSGRVLVTDAQRPVNGLVVHRGTVEKGHVKVGDRVDLHIDVGRRERTRRNHSATHLLHFALRKVVGEHAQQKGSLVAADRLRFDYTHTAPLGAEQVAEIERLVNERVLSNAPIQTEVLSIDAAQKRGAMMIFEEKYGDVVRMLTITPDSVELCGGTHARATGDIGLFKILSDEGVAAGVRRIIATTGEGSLAYVRGLEGQLSRASEMAKTGGMDLSSKIEKMVAEQKALQKQVTELQRKLMTGGGGGGMGDMLERAKDVAGVKVLGVRTEVGDRSAMRELAEQLRDKLGESVVLVGSSVDGKAQLVLTVSKGLTDRFQAGRLIKGVAEIVGGTGGGRPDMAQAGGTAVEKLDDAIAAVYSSVGEA